MVIDKHHYKIVYEPCPISVHTDIHLFAKDNIESTLERDKVYICTLLVEVIGDTSWVRKVLIKRKVTDVMNIELIIIQYLDQYPDIDNDRIRKVCEGFIHSYC